MSQILKEVETPLGCRIGYEKGYKPSTAHCTEVCNPIYRHPRSDLVSDIPPCSRTPAKKNTRKKQQHVRAVFTAVALGSQILHLENDWCITNAATAAASANFVVVRLICCLREPKGTKDPSFVLSPMGKLKPRLAS